MQFHFREYGKKALLAGLALMLVPLAAACKPDYRPDEVEKPNGVETPTEVRNEVVNYAQQLKLHDSVVDVLKPLGYDGMSAEEKAIMDEIYALPKSLQVHQETIDYVKGIAQDGISSDEVSGIYDLDHDGEGLTYEQEKELGTDPLKPNPNVKYALKKGLIPTYVKTEQIIPMDGNGEQEEREKLALDTAYKISQLDITDEAKRNNIAYALSKPSEFLGAYNSIPDELKNDYLELGIDDNIIEYLSFVSSLPDKDFADYALKTMFGIQDGELTELERNCLKDPNEHNIKELFNYNMSKIKNPELAKAFLEEVPEFKTIEKRDVEVSEDIADYLIKQEKVFGTTFDSMLEEGIPGKRGIWTPGQALVWILYDFDPEYLEREQPWEFPYKPKPNMRPAFRDTDLINMVRFSWSKSSTSNNYQSDEWKNFENVVDMLNSIELVGLWPFDYEEHLYPTTQSLEETFRTNKADCDDIARFRNYCLLKNGYNFDNFDLHKTNAVAGIGIYFNNPILAPSGNYITGHVVVIFKENNSFGYMITEGSVVRGLNTIEDVADRIGKTGLYGKNAGGCKYYTIHDKDWKTTKTVYR